MSEKTKTKTEKTDTGITFTVDSENTGLTEMPSITRLLNRKKLNKSNTYKETPAEKKPPSPPPTPPQKTPPPPAIEEQLFDLEPEAKPEDPPENPKKDSPDEINLSDPSGGFEIELSGSDSSPQETPPPTPQVPKKEDLKSELKPSPPAPSESTPVLKKAPIKPKETGLKKRLILWDKNLLEKNPDPLAKGLVQLLKNGVNGVVFLAIVAPPEGSPVPHFVGTAAHASPDRLSLWNGIHWDPTVVPDLWNKFVNLGIAELGPPGSETLKTSNRNVVRAAFGVNSDEWLTLVRTGPQHACRGVLALISNDSVQSAIQAALPLLTQEVNSDHAA